jgi:Mg-chelatase subunit ChlI
VSIARIFGLSSEAQAVETRSAAYVADAAYKRILSGPVVGDALFTAGGTGAGKTTAIRTSSQTTGLIPEAAVVYGSNFNSLEPARAKVTLALCLDRRWSAL